MEHTKEQKRTKHREWNPTPRVERLKVPENVRLVRAYVEGYADVAFWRTILNSFETPMLRFEISVPERQDMAKGKQVLLKMLENRPQEDHILCMDSDFDYLFGSTSPQSHLINSTPYLFQTYAYSTENYICYAPSLHTACVRATKCDVRIFDFEKFLAQYSAIIYPVFLWYAYSAHIRSDNYFTLLDFKTTVKLNYLDIHNNGLNTLEWLERQVARRLEWLEEKYPHIEPKIEDFGRLVEKRGIEPTNVYLFIQGHTLLDNVVMIMLNAVCEQLKALMNNKITLSQRTGQSLRNEVSNYNNELRNVRDVLIDNEAFKDCPLYTRLHTDLQNYLG